MHVHKRSKMKSKSDISFMIVNQHGEDISFCLGRQDAHHGEMLNADLPLLSNPSSSLYHGRSVDGCLQD